MFRIIIVLLHLLLIPEYLYSQIDILENPSELEKKEVLRILNEYEKFLTATGDSILPKEKRALFTLRISKELYNNDVQVLNDLDSASIGEDSFLKVFAYAQKLREKYPQTVTTKLSNINLSKVKYDKWRRYNFIEASCDKRMEWKKLGLKTIKDSVSLKDTLVIDTLRIGFTKKITFYIRFERINNISKNFKLLTIARTGRQPMLEPLPPIVLWWMDMDPLWKTYFKEKLKLNDYPASWEVERIQTIPELDISNKAFTNLEPLRKMTFLQKLKCVNTSIDNLEPLSGATGLIVLDITKTKVKSLEGIEKLSSLQELNCSGLLLKSIEPVKGLINLVKLDVSENELEDISPVADLVNLKELDFSSNVKLENISPVKNLTLLEKLSMRKVKAGSLDPVKNLVNLIHLDCYNTEILSLEPIRNHQKIIHLNIDHNPITTLDPIKNYRFIVYLSLSTSSVTNLAPISEFVNLRELDISNTQITTLGPVISKLEYIRVLRCQMSKVPKDEVARFKKNHPGADITYYY